LVEANVVELGTGTLALHKHGRTGYRNTCYAQMW